ncbi:STAS domain-containing protein [Streptomyces sp. SID13666]|uniref:STAS domain-containing protein n=1 Tax=Streptomyces TaxID=1883 RepID=UPI001105F938|nr:MULTISPECIES: STAS domain-containing protein [Streptomyces]MCZ4099222.1 STAS domain-containing protein [Streptomyces sp. H39-C1]NEA56032.1 STAS domain-containing protein [Streptomyces sp. SID13666]NEA71987.1 STAS domain-containing protein [Streptomyces sp. SID13588]QNA72198.1 STAS domain-containing protein [Streptomyces sp. So13.3]
MYDDQPAFGASRRSVAGTTVVELWGELDVLAAAGLSPFLDALARVADSDFIIDLRPVTFIDCSGLSLLCRFRMHALENGGRIRIVSADPSFTRLLRLTRLGRVFEIHPDLASALARHADDAGPGATNGAIA